MTAKKYVTLQHPDFEDVTVTVAAGEAKSHEDQGWTRDKDADGVDSEARTDLGFVADDHDVLVEPLTEH